MGCFEDGTDILESLGCTLGCTVKSSFLSSIDGFSGLVSFHVWLKTVCSWGREMEVAFLWERMVPNFRAVWSLCSDMFKPSVD